MGKRRTKPLFPSYSRFSPLLRPDKRRQSALGSVSTFFSTLSPKLPGERSVLKPVSNLYSKTTSSKISFNRNWLYTPILPVFDQHFFNTDCRKPSHHAPQPSRSISRRRSVPPYDSAAFIGIVRALPHVEFQPWKK
jgi:hypothetical protein